MNAELKKLIDAIEPLDVGAMNKAQERLDSLTKPQGSLGRLEDLARWIVGVTRDPQPRLGRKIVFTFAADHGVACEGVSAYPQAVTPQMVYNFLRGGAAINVLARQAKADVVVADFGVAADFADFPGLISCKVGYGTANMCKGSAMSEEQALQGILTGVRIARAEKDKGAQVFGTGDMGIGNTTSASALVAALTGAPAEEVTGHGTGIDNDVWRKKVLVVKQAIAVNDADRHHVLSTLAKVGGFEIAGLVGVILAGAATRTPVLLDGFISGAAALVACRLAPQARDYLGLAHLSVERGHQRIARELGLVPLLDFHMRLGEGSGAALAMPILDAACAIYNEMATFHEAGVSEKDKLVPSKAP